MIIIGYTILLFFSYSFTYLKYKRFLQMNTIFTVLWVISGILAELNLINLIPVSINVHKYIYVSIITFNLVFLLMGKRIKSNKIDEKISIENNNSKIKTNYKLAYILFWISFIIILPLLIQAIIGIITNGFSNYRGAIAKIASPSHVMAFINRNVTFGIFDAISLIAAVDLVEGRKKTIPIAILGIAAYTITYGGRYSLMNFTIYYICAFIILKGFKKVKLKKSYIILGISGLICVTLGRGTGSMTLIEMTILYFVGSLSFLQKILNYPSMYGLYEPLMFGQMTLGFIVEPIILTLKFIFGIDRDIPAVYFDMYAQKFTNIGYRGNLVMYNNNTTMFYHFIRDFGEVGILLGTAFLAIICGIAQSNYSRNRNKLSLYILIYLACVLLTSTMMYTMLGSRCTITLITLILISMKPIKFKY